MNICFVCLGNICRSPTAEAVFAHLAKQAGVSLRIDSAGTAGWHVGKKADSRSRAAAKERGYDITSRSRQFVAEDFARFDLILAMDADNESDILALAATDADREKVRLFRSFDPESPPGAEVPDPYYGGQDGFEEVLDICERASRGLLKHVQP